MNRIQTEETLQRLEELDARLRLRKEKRILNEGERTVLHLIQIAQPFLRTLTDIAQSLEAIANCQGIRKE